jgi:DNA-binding transcriptional LysR family regulator
VARLERELGVPLFRRVWRGVVLTEAGAALYEALRRGFATIDAAVEAVRFEGKRGHLTIVTDYAFAAFWLIPRLDALRAALGGRDVRLLTTQSGAEVDLAVGDLAIAFGAEAKPRWDVLRLVDEIVIPVARPGLLATPVEIASAPLLHLDLPGPGRWLDWPGYFRQLGLGSPIARPSGTAFNNYPLLMQAAIAGQGVALGWRPLVDDQIERGLVVPVGPEIRDNSRGYELILDPARSRDATSVARTWLLGAFAKDGEDHP